MRCSIIVSMWGGKFSRGIEVVVVIFSCCWSCLCLYFAWFSQSIQDLLSRPPLYLFDASSCDHCVPPRKSCQIYIELDQYNMNVYHWINKNLKWIWIWYQLKKMDLGPENILEAAEEICLYIGSIGSMFNLEINTQGYRDAH